MLYHVALLCSHSLQSLCQVFKMSCFRLNLILTQLICEYFNNYTQYTTINYKKIWFKKIYRQNIKTTCQLLTHKWSLPLYLICDISFILYSRGNCIIETLFDSTVKVFITAKPSKSKQLSNTMLNTHVTYLFYYNKIC